MAGATNLESDADRTRTPEMEAEIVLAEERERRRLASTLHDDVIQDLTAATFALDLARSGDPATARADLETVDSTISRVVKSVRSLMFEMSPPSLHEGGLEESLERLVESHEKRTGQVGHLRIEGGAHVLPRNVAVTLYQISRELLQNVVKHADANTVRIGLNWHAEEVELVVQDDGVGAKLDKIARGRSKGAGFGLPSIRDRAELMGGSMELENESGTRVRIRLPLKPSAG